MKRFAILIVLIMISSMALAACGGGSPTDAAKTAIEAMEKGDADKLNEVACEEGEADSGALEGVKIKFDDVKYEEKNKEDDSADVLVSGNMTMEVGEEEMSQDFSFTLKMGKKDGDWCVKTFEGF